MTKRGQSMCRICQLSAGSIAKDLQTLSGLQIITTTVRRELHGMGLHGRAAASKSYSTKCNAKLTNHASLSGNLMDVSGFGDCQENGTCLSALCQV
ncbi:unnamed protein product [Staurois parvus]|uniref:Transposase Tc1-like domain-containing protein n=1 Tax=Staurois parvus TaxID=386267 RepID=A0ABN9DFW6_9NEOB|nr:unnamed protein product [Staurois parvus]